jgi:hypothetical protein
MTKLLQAALRAVLPALIPFRGCASCPARPLPLAERRSRAPAARFPVDAVYTWVDGSDPALAAKRAAFLPEGEEHDGTRQDDARFRDNEELRYSLRSLEQYAPWVRRIFIVTDGQRPYWLNTEHPKVRVVDHREIIPAAYLPTVSSPPIEAFPHLTADPAEQYVYFNDDMFLASPSEPGDFFTPNGLPHIFTDWRRPRRISYARSATPHPRSHANVRRYLEERGIRPAPAFITAHGPYPQTKTNARDTAAFFDEAIRIFAQDKFRSLRGMVFYCHMAPLWTYAMRRALPCDMPYYYINTKRLDRRAYYAALLREAVDAPLLFYCLNDVTGRRTYHAWREDMAAFLAARYPKPSAFELREGTTRQARSNVEGSGK